MRFKPLRERQLIGDEDANAAAERHLQIAIQACLDIANHIVSSFGLERPAQETSEVFTVLAKEKIIPGSLAKRLVEATGYRNVIVHDYIDVDRHITYTNIQQRLPDLSEFAKYIERFLEKQKRR
jgi:uncharacterized protein YutE (UPF0331/DUF86 family)